MNDWVTKILSKGIYDRKLWESTPAENFSNFEAGPTEPGVKGNPPPFLIVGDPCSNQIAPPPQGSTDGGLF